MTIIATLPAGRYALLVTSLGWHTKTQGARGDRSAIAGIGDYDRAYIANTDDAHLRTADPIYQPVPPQDGPFDSLTGPAARVTLVGAERHYKNADDIMMAVQTEKGTMACTRVMVVVPAPAMEHDRASGNMWRIVDNDAPVVVEYDDCVLRVGTETIDLNAPQFFSVGMGEPIRPGDGVYELLGCAGMNKRMAFTRLKITQEMVDGLTAIGTPHAMKTLERANHFGIGQELDVMPTWVAGASDAEPVHMTRHGSGIVIRNGGTVYNMLSPRIESGQLMVEGIDASMVERLKAVGGDEAELAAEVVADFMTAETGGRAFFSLWRERLPLAA